METLNKLLEGLPQELYLFGIFLLGTILGGLVGKIRKKKDTDIGSAKNDTSNNKTKSIAVIEKELREKEVKKNIFTKDVTSVGDNQKTAPNNVQEKSLSDVLSAYPEAMVIYENRKEVLKHLIGVKKGDEGTSQSTVPIRKIIKARRLTDITYKYHKQLLGVNKIPNKLGLYNAIVKVLNSDE